MDIDMNNRDRKRYKSGDMLKDVPLAESIVPIFNDECLDDVMYELGYRIDVGKKAESYSRISKDLDPLEFYHQLEGVDSSNMWKLMYWCLSKSPSYQNKIERRDICRFPSSGNVVF